MLTVFSGLFSALSYATSDMFSQRVTRETRALTQMLWVLVLGAAVLVPVALILRGVPEEGERVGAALAALAGVLYFGAFLCLLRGLEVGDLGLISALVSLEGAYLAVSVILLGEPVTPFSAAALALCVVGAVLASLEGPARSTRGVPWALASGMLFTGVMLCYNYGEIDWLSQAAISRGVSLLIALPAAALTGGAYIPPGLRLRAVGAGALELCGLVAFTITFALGPPAVAGVTIAQSGTFAVVLGSVLLHERPRSNQWAGIACTVTGVTLLAAIT